MENREARIQLPFGTNVIWAYYTGDDYEVEPLNHDISSYAPQEMDYGQIKEIRLPKTNNATLKVYIGFESQSGVVIAEFGDLNQAAVFLNKSAIDEAIKIRESEIEDNYKEYESYFLDLTPVVYDGGINYQLQPIRVNFKAELTGGNDITMQYSQSKTFNLKVYDLYGNLAGEKQAVKIKIGSKTFTAKTDKNGEIKFKIPNTITPGKYGITATYKNAEVTKKLTVKQILSVKTVKVKKSAKKLVLTATLKKVNGKYLKNKKITFKFKGKKYTAKTNKKGVAKVTVKSSVLKKLKDGKKVTYQATYLKDTVKKTVKVKK